MSIEVGEYVRIKYMYNNATIAKITEKRGKDPCYKNKKMYRIDRCIKHDGTSYSSNLIYDEDIIKHSKNIAELIEPGDYVNGFRVDELKDENNKSILVIAIWDSADMNYVKDFLYINEFANEIKSIVTKEQFENMEYEVEE